METRRSSSRRSSSSASRSIPPASSASAADTQAFAASVPVSSSETSAPAAASTSASCPNAPRFSTVGPASSVLGNSSNSPVVSSSNQNACESPRDTTGKPARATGGASFAASHPPGERTSALGPLTRSRSITGKRTASAVESSFRSGRRAAASDPREKRPRIKPRGLSRSNSPSTSVAESSGIAATSQRAGMSDNSNQSPSRSRGTSLDNTREEHDAHDVTFHGLLRRLGAVRMTYLTESALHPVPHSLILMR